jgi:HlyD family secretion protein
MRLRLSVMGAITSLEPKKAVVSATANAAAFLQAGQSVDFEVQIRPTDGRGGLPVISGRVSQILSRGTASIQAEIEFAVPFPDRTTVGTRIGALLDTKEELQDVVFFDRPADARPNTESIIFLIEPGDEYAKRVSVRYGRQSGAQMEIISGLVPGDRVIVTDMSAWASYPRVRLK